MSQSENELVSMRRAGRPMWLEQVDKEEQGRRCSKIEDRDPPVQAMVRVVEEGGGWGVSSSQQWEEPPPGGRINGTCPHWLPCGV